MQKIHLLIRQISAYTGPNIVLGASLKRQWIESQQQAYIDRYRQKPEDDPWQLQGYKDGDVLINDVVIETYDIAAEWLSTEVSIVSKYIDGMGMVGRHIDSVHVSRSSAEERCQRIRSNADGDQPVPDYGMPAIQTIPLDVLLSDKKQDQRPWYLQ